MSRTMFLGRVVLPAIGLLLAVGCPGNSVRNVTARTGSRRHRRPSRASAGPIARPDHRRGAGRRLSRRRGDRRHGGPGTIINMPAREKAVRA